MKNIVVLGEGAWGTALAQTCAHAGYPVMLWCQDPDVATQIKTTRENARYLPGYRLNDLITPTPDISALVNADWVILTTPLTFLRAVLTEAKPHITKKSSWIFANKGLEASTLFTVPEVFRDVMGFKPASVMLSGPSFAHDLMREQPTAVTLAGEDLTTIHAAQKLLETTCLTGAPSSDVIGTAFAATYKNVCALGMGILIGSGYTENTKAWFLTCALHELTKLVIAAGGKKETALSLAGIGDLMLTSYSAQSRNVRCGIMLGQGATVAQAHASLGVLPEGINSLGALKQWCTQHSINLPLLQAVYDRAYLGASSDALVAMLKHYSLA